MNVKAIQSLILMPAFFVLGTAGFASRALADTDAVAVSGYTAVGYNTGGAGFSFVPSTNLIVTRVGYLYMGEVDPVISIWSSTNSVLASYELAPGTSSLQMVYTNITLTLAAGQPYSITLQDGPLAAGNSVVFQASSTQGSAPNGQFQVAPDLTHYVGEEINSSGAFFNFDTNLFFLGPNFSYQIQPAQTLNPPMLTIQRIDPVTVTISWPSPSLGWMLQTNSNLGVLTWSDSGLPVSDNGTTRSVTISPPSGTQFFRLSHQ